MSDEIAAAAEPVCDTCKNVGDTGGNHWYWQCYALIRLPKYSFVTGKNEPDPPRFYCREMNAFGQCRFYEPNPAGSAAAKRRNPDAAV